MEIRKLAAMPLKEANRIQIEKARKLRRERS
jgi:hypothetical protein